MFVNLNNLSPFLKEPNRHFHLREYAKVLKISPATASKYLSVLVGETLVVKKNGKLYKVFKANIDNPLFRQYKIFFNITKVMDSGLLDFLDKELAFPTVIMFGSCAKGEDLLGSDLDLLVSTNTIKELDLSAFEKHIGKNIQLFIMDDVKLKEATKKSPELVNNMLNGVKLRGFLKLF
jgi:predicted nucleotidyltransferase